MYKYVMVALLIVASVLGVVYTFDAVLEAESQRELPPEDNELRLVAGNFYLDQEEYVVQQGETVILTLRNESGYHEFEFEGLDINLTDAEPIEFTFDEPGTYTIRCSFLCGTGHDDMVSTLVVEAASADAPEDGGEEPAEDDAAA